MLLKPGPAKSLTAVLLILVPSKCGWKDSLAVFFYLTSNNFFNVTHIDWVQDWSKLPSNLTANTSSSVYLDLYGHPSILTKVDCLKSRGGQSNYSIDRINRIQSNLIEWLNSIDSVNRRAIESEKNVNSIGFDHYSINFDWYSINFDWYSINFD